MVAGTSCNAGPTDDVCHAVVKVLLAELMLAALQARRANREPAVLETAAPSRLEPLRTTTFMWPRRRGARIRGRVWLRTAKVRLRAHAAIADPAPGCGMLQQRSSEFRNLSAMPANTAVLEESTDEKGTCVRRVGLAPDASLRHGGHDLGPFVERFSGPSEYEFVGTVPPSGVDQLRRQLSAGPDEDSIGALATRFRGPGRSCPLEMFLAQEGIESELWNRVGD